MTEQDLKTIAAAGVANAMGKHPLAWALVFLVFANIWVGWKILSESRDERAAQSEYVQLLHAQLVECHREK